MKSIFMKKYWLLLGAVFVFSLTGCDSDNNKDPEFNPGENPKTDFAYILNEGNFKANNTSIMLYNKHNNTGTDFYYKRMNGEPLGDTGQDILVYGNKVYISIYGSGRLLITDKKLNKLGEISAGKDRAPREFAAGEGKVFVSFFDGHVGVIDTVTLKLDSKLYKVGRNPEGIVYQNGYVYVVNSGGLDAPNYDSTLSKINLKTGDISTIEVGKNPTSILPIKDNKFLIRRNGEYDENKDNGGLLVYDPKTDKVKAIDGSLPGLLAVSGNKAYYITTVYNFEKKKNDLTYNILDLNTLKVKKESFLQDTSMISDVRAIAIDPFDKDIYIADPLGYKSAGKIHVFDKNGKFKKTFSAGISPKKIIFF